jgi:enoyl-CoA hydratase
VSVIDVRDHGRTRVITLNRPAVRNAINSELLLALRGALAAADDDAGVDVVVLTGADPAFCAGVDLKALADGEDAELTAEVLTGSHRPWPLTTKPVIGAVNGAAVTGGLELVLACDLLVASDRAFFADTHARVGIMPSWELSVRLPVAVGRRLATWMSLTGNPLSAGQAERAGLVSVVCDHEVLLDTAIALADDIGTADQSAARALLGSYRRSEDLVWAEGFEVESATGDRWRASAQHDTGDERRQRILERNRERFSRDSG